MLDKFKHWLQSNLDYFMESIRGTAKNMGIEIKD